MLQRRPLRIEPRETESGVMERLHPLEHRVLAGAIMRLHDEPVLREKLGRAGCAAARSGYSASAIIGQVEALYTELAGRTVA